VTWEDPVEVKQAVDLLPAWVDIDVDDALELLGPVFTNASVQHHAVEQLKSADDEVISPFFLQFEEFIKMSDYRNLCFIYFNSYKRSSLERVFPQAAKVALKKVLWPSSSSIDPCIIPC
jgi:phosphatidylinositol 3-kinase